MARGSRGGTFGLDSDLIEEMQALVEGGGCVVDVVAMLRENLRLERGARFPILVYLAEAFSLSVKDVKPLGGWRGFPGGTKSDEEVNDIFEKLIVSK